MIDGRAGQARGTTGPGLWSLIVVGRSRDGDALRGRRLTRCTRPDGQETSSATDSAGDQGAPIAHVRTMSEHVDVGRSGLMRKEMQSDQAGDACSNA